MERLRPGLSSSLGDIRWVVPHQVPRSCNHARGFLSSRRQRCMSWAWVHMDMYMDMCVRVRMSWGGGRGALARRLTWHCPLRHFPLPSNKSTCPASPQASGLALDAITDVLGWPAERMLRTLDRMGNVVAASIPLTLHEGIASGAIRRGDKLLLMGTGAGLSFGGMILTY